MFYAAHNFCPIESVYNSAARIDPLYMESLGCSWRGPVLEQTKYCVRGAPTNLTRAP